ncbi:uncharacterized protein LOC118815848 isoform X2 [Colossoma macropomum]|uniref:uncharacterized protein LOC118815848 isoform X2 n=1 Tax=Colossoma macropomum TaxID=42526 RepID=UPI001864C8C0|nr:uncharacterized protein LOC118815848 isoform X2 [Colossoma macropomum]
MKCGVDPHGGRKAQLVDLCTPCPYVPPRPADLTQQKTVLYSMEDFAGMNPSDILHFLQTNRLTDSLPRLYSLACLVVTIPASTASVDRSFSALKRIKSYARNTTGPVRLSSLVLLAIEKHLLIELKRNGTFSDKVINNFLAKERRLDFIFKYLTDCRDIKNYENGDTMLCSHSDSARESVF